MTRIYLDLCYEVNCAKHLTALDDEITQESVYMHGMDEMRVTALMMVSGEEWIHQVLGWVKFLHAEEADGQEG